MVTIAERSGVSYSGLVRNIKLGPSDEKLPLQETILDYIYKIERAFPDLIAKMPQRPPPSIDNIIAKKLQTSDGSNPLFTRALLELVLEEIQELKIILEDIKQQRNGKGPDRYEGGEN
jgi:hypothetical protein